MSAPILNRRALVLTSGDVALHLALGLLSATRRMGAIVERHAVPSDTPAAGPAGAAAVDLVLGLLAFRKTLLRIVTSVPEPLVASPAPHPPRTRSVPWR